MLVTIGNNNAIFQISKKKITNLFKSYREKVIFFYCQERKKCLKKAPRDTETYDVFQTENMRQNDIKNNAGSKKYLCPIHEKDNLPLHILVINGPSRTIKNEEGK